MKPGWRDEPLDEQPVVPRETTGQQASQPVSQQSSQRFHWISLFLRPLDKVVGERGLREIGSEPTYACVLRFRPEVHIVGWWWCW